MLLLSACNGILEGIYDEPQEQHQQSTDGELYIDASSWTDWYYIDLKALANEESRQQALNEAGLPYPIPTTPAETATDGKSGIYTYWYDVWGAGLSVNERRSVVYTSRQTEPEHWTLAVHRDNVRTNGGSACETNYTDIQQLADNRQQLDALPYTADEWTENAVWTDQSQMLNSLIGCQGIAINPVLSAWLTVDIPPIPPAFTHNRHVFVLRLDDGTYAALQLSDYISATGTKCCLSIRYKYPL